MKSGDSLDSASTWIERLGVAHGEQLKCDTAVFEAGGAR